MSTTTNPDSLLWQLRRLVPRRPLSVSEGYRVAELQASRLLAWGGIDQPGTPSELVSHLPYVQVQRRPDHPESGYLNWFKPRWLVVLNATEPTVRQRFSLMHEFKHLLDHPYRDFLYPSTYFYEGERRRELAADYFAACVLMPQRLVKRRWDQGVRSVAALAVEFDVSQDAMHRRLQDLRLIKRPPRCIYPALPAPPSGTEYFRHKAMPLAVAA
jgi:predicted transcriptional regulator